MPNEHRTDAAIPSNTASGPSDGPPSPLSPPYSPLTPNIPNAQLANQSTPASLGPASASHALPSQSQNTHPDHVASGNLYTSAAGPSPGTSKPTSGPGSAGISSLPRDSKQTHSLHQKTSPTQGGGGHVQHQEPSPPEPPPRPIDLETNTDAIALKAAMSILSLQRKQAIADMQMLNSQKELALRDPRVFAAAVKKGEIGMRNSAAEGLDFDAESDDDLMDGVEHQSEKQSSEQAERESHATSPSDQAKARWLQEFGQLPSAQNVVRTPPVNWSKYHIVGSALDALHNQQVSFPDDGRPRTDQDVQAERLRHLAQQGKVPGRAGAAAVQAPYNIFKDELLGTDSLTTPSATNQNTALGAAGTNGIAKVTKIGADGVKKSSAGPKSRAAGSATKKKNGAGTGPTVTNKKKGKKAGNTAAAAPAVGLVGLDTTSLGAAQSTPTTKVKAEQTTPLEVPTNTEATRTPADGEGKPGIG